MTDSSVPSGTFLYVVACTFEPHAGEVASAWLAWVREEHIQEVLMSGALSAEVLRVTGTALQFEIHYRFAGQENFKRYERDEAPRLRAEGLRRFPLTMGLSYQRKTATQLDFQTLLDSA